MKFEIRKKVLFDFLKKSLNENRTNDNISGIYTNPYFYKGENINPFLDEDDDEDMPIAPSNHMASYKQLTVAEVPVDDPDFVPASIDELKNSLVVIANNVPLNQIDYFYRASHRILDNALDRAGMGEDYEEESEEESVVKESINISRRTTIKDFKILSESIDDIGDDDLDRFYKESDESEGEYGEYVFTFPDGRTTVINFDGREVDEVIKDVVQMEMLAISRDRSEITRGELANITINIEELIKKGYDTGVQALRYYNSENDIDLGTIETLFSKIFTKYLRKSRDRKIKSLRDNNLFRIGFRLGCISELILDKEAKSMPEDEMEDQLKDISDMEDIDKKSIQMPTEKDISDPRARDLGNIEDTKELYDEIAVGDNHKLVAEAALIAQSVFYRVMKNLDREDGARYQLLTQFEGWKNPEQYKDSFPLHGQYGVNFFSKILTNSDQFRFVFTTIDDPKESIEKFKEYINNILRKHFIELGKDAGKLKRLSEIASKLQASGLPLTEPGDKEKITIESLLNEITSILAEEMYKNACKEGMRNPETGEVNNDKFIQSYIRQIFASSRKAKKSVEQYNKHFLSKGSINREFKRFREITFLNMIDESDVGPLTNILLARIFENAENDPDNPERIVIKFLRVTMDVERRNYTEKISVSATELSEHVQRYFELLASAAQEVQQKKADKIQAKASAIKKARQPTEKELKAIEKREKEKARKAYKNVGQYLMQNSSSGGRQVFLRGPNLKFLFMGGPDDDVPITIGYDADSGRWLFIDFINSLYDIATPIFVKKMSKVVDKAAQNMYSPEVRKKQFIKTPANVATASLLSAAKQDLIEINKLIINNGFESHTQDVKLQELLQTLGGRLLRNFINSITNEVFEKFVKGLLDQIATKLGRILPKVSFLKGSNFSKDDLGSMAEYFIGLKNRPTRLDFKQDRRNTRLWKNLGFDYNSFEAVYQTVYEEVISESVIEFYQITEPIFDPVSGDITGYDYSENDPPDIYPEIAQDIIKKFKESDADFEKRVKTAVADYLNFEETLKRLDDERT